MKKHNVDSGWNLIVWIVVIAAGCLVATIFGISMGYAAKKGDEMMEIAFRERARREFLDDRKAGKRN